MILHSIIDLYFLCECYHDCGSVEFSNAFKSIFINKQLKINEIITVL